MTEDYKNLTLNYITGNLELGSMGDNGFRDTSNYLNNFTINLENRYGVVPSTMSYLTGETTSNFIIYGTYDDMGTYRGYIAVLNQKGDIETCFTEYDSGTKLPYLYKLQYDENGNIYGLDEVDSKLRVILLNNVAVKGSTGYTCRLRNSYYVPNEYNTLYAGYDYDVPGFIKKAEGKATYYLFGDTQVSGNTSRPTLIKFVINVGSTNEWTAYYYGSGTTNAILSSDFFIEPGEENDTVVALMTYYATVEEYKLSEGTFTQTYTYERPEDYTSFETSRLIAENHFYTAVRSSSPYNTALFEIDMDRYQLLTSRTMPSSSYWRRLCYKNGILFDKIRYYNSETDEGNTYVGFYDGKDYVSEEIPFVYKSSGLEVLNNFGLYQMLIQGDNNLVKPSVVVYPTSYSGESYNNYNSLVALHGELYSNGNIIFARNLYNKQTYGNITTSTLNVPNNFLNDVVIGKKDLVSATMTTLTTDTTEISKNIYENLFINFSNKINVVDEDTSTLYPNTASYINVGTSTGTKEDYEGSMLSKIRVNYEDGSLVQTISWEDISTDQLIAKQTTFSIYVSSPITSIDFINEDETFIYLTKEYQDLTVGNYYTISQKIRIE